jgi:uncharacterized protein
MSRVVQFEVYADQPERALAFYRTVFGWRPETGAPDPLGVDGEPVGGHASCPPAINPIDPAAADNFAAQVPGGGRMVTPKMNLPGVGSMAFCQDAEGNLFGIFEEDRSAL